MAGAKSYEEAKARMLENIQLVAEEIGPAWQKLGRKLRISEAAITNIDTEYKRMKEKAYQALLKWYHGHGQAKATKKVLCEALAAVGQTIIAEKLGCSSGNSCRRPDPKQKTCSLRRKSAMMLPRCTSVVIVKTPKAVLVLEEAYSDKCELKRPVPENHSEAEICNTKL